MAIEVLFLAWDSPWPAHYGGACRTLGLLTELSAAFEVELLVLMREPLRVDQLAALASVSARVTEIPLRDATLTQRLRNALWPSSRTMMSPRAASMPAVHCGRYAQTRTMQ
jgi:hypothetical protein